MRPTGSAVVRRARSVGVLLAGLAVIVSAAAVPRASDLLDVASAWRGQPIRIDGNDEDWHGLTAPVRGQRFALGLLNDADAVYLCLLSRDRVVSTQIERQGLMVWLDPAGARKHVFGVQFPVDPRLQAMRGASRPPRSGANRGDPGPEAAGQDAVGILGPGKTGATRVALEEAGGIEARLGRHGDLLVYEMKIPLRGGDRGPYVVDAEPGGRFRLELQTPEWRGPMPVARGPIAFGAAGPGPAGRGMIVSPPIDGAMLRPTDASMTVQLAAAGR
jgi:hypothetical protein